MKGNGWLTAGSKSGQNRCMVRSKAKGGWFRAAGQGKDAGQRSRVLVQSREEQQGRGEQQQGRAGVSGQIRRERAGKGRAE